MADPGDGSLHQEYNLHAAQVRGATAVGATRRDVYNPARFGEMLKSYLGRKKELAAGAEDG